MMEHTAVFKSTNCQSTNSTLPHTDNVHAITLLQLYRAVEELILNQLGLVWAST